MLRSLKAYFMIDLKLFLREPIVLFFTLLLPAFMYIVLAFLFGKATYGPQKVPYYDRYTASFTAIILLNIALFNVGPGLVIYKEVGFFRRLLATPLDMSAVLISTITRAFVLFLLGMVEIIFIGWLLFERMPPNHPFQMLGALVVSAFSLFSFGFLLGSLYRRSASAFAASIFLFQPMMLLSGASIPLEVFPPSVLFVSKLVPMTYVVSLLRLGWMGSLFTPAAATAALGATVFGVASTLIARKTFRWSAS